MKLRITKVLSLLTALLLVVEGVAVAAPKTEAAVSGTVSAAPQQSPMEMLLERDGFLNGINYLWIDDGHTFADNQMYGFTENTFSDGDGEAIVYNDMYNIKALGYNSIHIMLSGGRMEGVRFDENGHILGLDEEYKRNFRRFLEILDETDTYFAAYLQFHTSKIYSELGKVAWDHATQYYGNEEVRQEYIDLVMRPLLEMLRDFDHRVLFLSLGDELENELNDVDADWNYDLDRAVYGVSFADMYGYYSDMNDLCKQVMPDTPRTIGANWDDLWQYGELDLDAMGRNVYSQFGDDFQHIDDERYKCGLPMYFPEWGINCWTYDMDYPTFMERNILMLNEIKARGYFGAFFWRYEHTQKSDAELTMYNSFWEYPSDYNEMATTFAYEAIDDENARLGLTPKLDTPKMFAYHGDGLVTWLTARQGDTFDLERSLDGGKTWVKLLTGAAKRDYRAPRNANIGYYQDTDVPAGAAALYRVRAYGGGVSTLSEPAPQVVHRADLPDDQLPAGTDDPVVAVDPAKNLLQNGGFENGLNGWSIGSSLTYELVGDQQGHDSNTALKISDKTNRWGRIQQDVTLKPGKIYRITFSYRDLTLRGTANVSVQFSADGNYTTDSPSFSQDFESEDTAWHTVDVTFTSNNHTHGRLRFMPSSGAGIEFLIDNLHLELVGEDTNLLQNGYFADGLNGWRVYAVNGSFCTVKAGIGPDGSAAAELGGATSWTAELSTAILPVEKHTDYVVDFDMYHQNGHLGGVFVKGGYSATSADKGFVEIWPGAEKNSWKHQTLRFNSGDYTHVRVAFGNPVDGETYRVDNVVWKQEADSPIRQTVTSYHPQSLVALNDSYNLLTDPGFEAGTGQWNAATLVDGTTVKVVSDGTAKFGNKHLEFHGKGLTDPTTAVFYVDVEPNENYTFSAWIRSMGLGDGNNGDITIGIMDPATGHYLVGEPVAWDDGCRLDFSAVRSLVPPAFDGSWHLRGMSFDTRDMTRVGIMIRGGNAQLSVDDMTLCLTAKATKYVSEKNAHGIVTKMYWDETQCAPTDNLLENYNLEEDDLSFWSASHGFGRFVTLTESKYQYGTSLRYAGGENPLGYTYIRWVDVKPNTKYVMSFHLKVVRDGDGYFGLIDGKDAHAAIFDRVYFDGDTFSDPDQWLTMSFAFNSGVHTRIGLVIHDGGGEALLDNLRLFEQSKAKTVKDLYTYTNKVTNNVAYGKTASVTARAEGDGLKYAWYYKNKGASKFTKTTSVTGKTYSVAMDKSRDGRQVYCVITDKYGVSRKTATTTLTVKKSTPKITTQPQTATYAKYGETAKVTVKASGDGLKYQWYIKNDGASKYSKSSVTSATYSVTMSDKAHGRRLYCVITDAWGKKLQTKTVQVRMAATITTQPKTTTVKKNTTAKLTVKAKGEGLKYTWYVKNAGSKKYSKSSVTKSTYSVKMTSKVNGRYVYCVVTDKYGKKVQSKTVRVKMK